jgi:hypothetical protein
MVPSLVSHRILKIGSSKAGSLLLILRAIIFFKEQTGQASKEPIGPELLRTSVY